MNVKKPGQPLPGKKIQDNKASPAGVVCRFEKADIQEVGRVVPMVEIPFMRAAPALDGVLGAAEWRDAAPLDDFLTPGSGEPVSPATHCRLGMDKHNLYLAFRCEALADGADIGPMKNDRVEFFILPDAAKPFYFLFAVGATGVRRTVKKNIDAAGRPGVSAEQPNTAWQAAVAGSRAEWTVEAAVPWAMLGVEPVGCKGIRLNCCRSTSGQNLHKAINSSWAFLPLEMFNVPDKFGVGLCNFDRRKTGGLAPENLRLYRPGLLYAQRRSPIFPAADKFEVLCMDALPAHPLLARTAPARLIPEVVQVDGDGRKGCRAALAEYALQPRQPVRVVVGGLDQEDYLLGVSFEAGGQCHTCDFPVVRKSLNDVEKHLRSLPEVAAQEPLRATACLGLAAAVDRLVQRTNMERPQGELMTHVREVQARLNVLYPERPDIMVADGMLDLLNLTRDPEAQVVAEYLHSQNNAVVTFYCGAVPLVSVNVKEYATPEEAAAMLPKRLDQRKQSPMLDSGAEVTTVAGRPARINTKSYDPWADRPMIAPFDPARQILLADLDKRSGLALDLNYLDCALAAAAVILPGCPAEVRASVEIWAARTGIPLVAPADAPGGGHVLFAGNPRSQPGIPPDDQIRAAYPMTEKVNGTVSMTALDGKRLYSVWHAHRTVAAEVLRIVMEGKRVAPAAVDALRLAIVKHCRPRAASAERPDGMSIFCGDMHIHTSYSHGDEEASPVGVALESLYCQMDFIVISDHDRIDGAQIAQRFLKEHHVDHTLIVGEEIGAGSHLNAYPLKNTIRARSQAEAVEAAHRQGALIQWNHPDSDIATMRAAVGDGFDAWEHFPRQFHDEWKKAGTLPVLIGSSDSHVGTFGFYAFGYGERTLIVAPGCREKDVVNAIRDKRVVLVTPQGGGFFYGPEAMVAAAWSALAEGAGLKAVKAASLRATLKRADVMGLLMKKAQGRFYP